MIKSLISNCISKYVIIVSPDNIRYNIFTSTIDVYDVSINPDFLPNEKSNIAHLSYRFSFIKEKIIIKNIYLELKDLSFLNKQSDQERSIEIQNATILYYDFEIKILEIIDNVIRGVEIHFKGHKIISISKMQKTNFGFYVQKMCIDITKLEKLLSADNQSNNFFVSYLNKYKIDVDSAKGNASHLFLRRITILESEIFSCKIRSVKFYSLRLRNIQISLKDKIIIKNKSLLIKLNKKNLGIKIFKELDFKPQAQDSAPIKISSMLLALHKCPKFDVNVSYLGNKFNFTIDKHIYNFKYHEILEIEKIEIKKFIYIKNVKYKFNTEETNNLSSNNLLDDIYKIIDCNVIVDSISTENLYIKRFVYELNSEIYTQLLFHQEKKCENIIDLIKLSPLDGAWSLNIDGAYISDIKSLLCFYQEGENSLFSSIQIYNLRILHNEVELIGKTLTIQNSDLSSVFDIKVASQYFIENCNIVHKQTTTEVDKLFVNISENIVCSILESNIIGLIREISLCFGSENKKAMVFYIQSIFLNLYNTANEEIFCVILSDLDILYYNYNLSLNLKSAQIDNQEYLSRSPRIFKSLGDDFLALNIANNEIFINLGKFKLYYEDLLEAMIYVTRLFSSSSENQYLFDIQALHINDIECSIFYRYFVDLKIPNVSLKSLSGTFPVLKDRLFRLYRSKINKNILGLIFKNIKNNIYIKSQNLGYKDDMQLPVPWYTKDHTEFRIKYPMPMRNFIERYDLGLCAAFYIFNKLKDKNKHEIFRDGTFVNISYKNKEEESFIDNHCLILSNTRLIMSSKLNIKEVCMEEVSIKESSDFFMIGDIKIKVERREFISSLCKYLLNK
ncbi:uncharacterized protein VNE69_01375 [Vairimorpha necatrix]|uniref:Uncharacterized protein n=1 Tax=Vairimorpha necatrix TaxID=6039 RepID=A0AAX4J8X4_9MICR